MRSKSEQLKFFGNVIDFPKNQDYKSKELSNKYNVAIELLNKIIDLGGDFNITINREIAEELFELGSSSIEVLTISTSKDFEKANDNKRKGYYYIKGDELV